MGRPPAKDLTERELEVMHDFWREVRATAAEARERLAAAGLDRTYTTIANLVRGLHEKGFLQQSRTRSGRSSTGRRGRTRTSPAGCWATSIERVFRGSRAQLLLPARRAAEAHGRGAGGPGEDRQGGRAMSGLWDDIRLGGHCRSPCCCVPAVALARRGLRDGVRPRGRGWRRSGSP